MIRVLLLLLFTATAALADFLPPTPFWWLNSLFDTKQIGRWEGNINAYAGIGPCPSANLGQRCQFDFADLPASVLNYPISLPGFWSGYTTISDILSRGEFHIYKTQLSKVEITNVAITGARSADQRSQTFKVVVSGFKSDIKTSASLVNVKFADRVPVPRIDIDATLDKSEQNAGTNIELEMRFDAPIGKTLNNSVPNNVTLIGCDLDLSFGLSLGLDSAFPFSTNAGDFVQLAYGTLEPVLGGFLCTGLEKLFAQDDQGDGLVQNQIVKLYDNLGNLADKPTPVISAGELELINNVTSAKHESAFNFGDSVVVKGLSSIANSWLGVDGSGGRPVVNEVMNLLTMPNNGTAKFYNLASTGLLTTVTTPPFFVDLELVNLTLNGLNSFKSDGFQLLLNGYENSPPVTPKLNYTLDNVLKMDHLGVSLVGKVTLRNRYGYTPGAESAKKDGWLYRPNTSGPEETSFRVYYDVGLNNIDLRAAVSLLLNSHELADRQLGQVLGKSGGATTIIGQAAQAGKCTAKSLYGIALPFLTVAATLEHPVFGMQPEDIGIKNMVDGATAQVLDLLEGVIVSDMPLITQHWLRPTVNTLLMNHFSSTPEHESEDHCPIYYTQGKITPNFLTSRAFSSAKTLIHDVVGGNPVKASSASINTLLDQVVAFGCAATDGLCTSASAGKWNIGLDIYLDPSHTFNTVNSAAGVSKLQITALQLSGMDSVTVLTVDNIPNKPQGLDVLFKMGTATNPLKLQIDSHWIVKYLPSLGKVDTDETFGLGVTIEDLELKLKAIPDYDLDMLYQLTMKDLGNSACLMAPLAALELPELDLTMGRFTVAVTRTTSPLPGTAGKLALALQQLLAEQPHNNVAYMLNFILKSATTFAKTHAVSATNTNGLDAYTCQYQVNAFDNVLTRVAKKLLTGDLPTLFDKGFGPQPVVPSVEVLEAEAEAKLPFGFTALDFTKSKFVPMISNAVAGLTTAQVHNVLFETAEDSGNFLADSLFKNLGGGVDLDVDLLELFPDGFSIDSTIQGGMVYATRLFVSDITNLDIDGLEVLKPVGKYTTNTRIRALGTMKIKVGMRIVVPESFKGIDLASTELKTTNLEFSMDIVDLDIDLQALTALSFSKISSFTLGNFIQVDSDQTFSINPAMWGCLFGLSYSGGFYFPKLMIGVSSFGEIKLQVDDNFLISEGSVRAANAVFEILNDFYAADIKDITQGALRFMLNDFFLVPNLEKNRVCPTPLRPNLYGPDRILDFTRSSTVDFINKATKDYLAGSNGKYSVVNAMLNGALNGVTFLNPNEGNQLGVDYFDIIYHKQVFGGFKAYLGSLKVGDLGSFSNLELLRPTSNTTVYNAINIAGPLTLDGEVSFSFRDIWVDGTEERTNNVFLNVMLTNVTLEFELNLEIDLVDLMLVQASTLTQFSQISCAATAFDKVEFRTPKFDIGKIGATLSCINCENTMLKPLNNGGELTTGDSDVLTDMLPDALHILGDFIGSTFLNDKVDDGLENADATCMQSLNATAAFPVFNAPELVHTNVAVILALALLGLACGVFVLFPFAVPRHYQLKDRMLAEHLQAANKEPGANAQSIARYMAKQERLSIAVAFHPSVSYCCRCFVPVMAVINVVLLALSFLVYLAFSIDAAIVVGGDRTKVFPLVPWTVSSTINDFWDSGAQPIALLVVFLSCFWPVSKNLAMIILWYAPRTLVSHRLRMKTLVVLDMLGKWSFVDAYIIVVLVAGLRFTMSVGSAPILEGVPLPLDLLTVEVLVTPGVGIVILCIAACMSLVVNHVIIYLLEHATWVDNRLFKQIDGAEDDMLTDKPLVRIAVCDYVFSTSAPNGERDRFNPKYKPILIICTVITYISLIICMAIPYFTMHYYGLIGYLLKYGIQTGRLRECSLFGVMDMLGTATDGSAYYTALFAFFQILWLATVLIPPFLQLALQLVGWLYPMDLKTAHKVLFFSKVANYWASLEVFAVAIVATKIEIAPVAAFLLDAITGGGCSALRAPLNDVFGPENASCLFTIVEMEIGFYLTIVANLMHTFLGALFIRAIGVALRDREDVLEKRPHQVWTMWEYRVMNYLFVNGAEHHKPPVKDKKKRCQCALDCAENPFACFSLTKCCSCFKGVSDVSLNADTHGKKVAGTSKWNVAPPQSSQWNTAPPQSGQWNNSANFSAAGGGVQNSSQWNNDRSQVVSSNPVFSMEARKPQYSVDV